MRAIYGLYPFYLTVFWAMLALPSKAETLTVGWLNDNVNERYLISDIEQEFAKIAPDITLNAVGVHTDKYKQQVLKWLKTGEGPDVLYWYGDERLLDLYRQMVLVRAVEERLYALFAEGKLFGTTHAYTGQEAVAVGVVSALDKARDIVTSNHRANL